MGLREGKKKGAAGFAAPSVPLRIELFIILQCLRDITTLVSLCLEGRAVS